MKKFLFAVAVMFSGLTLFAQNDIVVDANASVRQLNGSFTTIKVSGGIDLFLSQSDNVSLAISAANETLKEGIKTNIENGVLLIFFKGDKSRVRKDRKLKVYVSFKELNNINASGACDLIVAGSIRVPSLVLQMSGACDFNGKVEVENLKLNLSGASDAKISGTAKTVDIVSSGASDVKGYELVTDMCNANVSGASDINITVKTELNANAHGASNIFFKGEALIRDMKSSGSSTIARKN